MADESEKEEGKGFKVQDRRRFSDSGDVIDESSADTASETPPQATDEWSDQSKDPSQEEALPPINFPTFVISLSTQALMHLGEIPNPLTGKVEKEISAAKQTIDILSLLKEKTTGNLDEGEDKLMEEVLYDLRMKYVQAVRKK